MDETKNRQLHELLGRCWGDAFEERVLDFVGKANVCVECGGRVNSHTRPAYDRDLNLVHEVEKEVIEAVGERRYGLKLNLVLGDGNEGDNLYDRFTKLATATAEQRVDACIEVLKSARGESDAT